MAVGRPILLYCLQKDSQINGVTSASSTQRIILLTSTPIWGTTMFFPLVSRLHLRATFKRLNYANNLVGVKVIVIDSLSHEWDGEGGVLEIHAGMIGNSFTNWSKVTPRHNSLVQKILQSDCHIIVTFRTKQDYVLSDKNGKMTPEKVGLKSVTKDGMDYEFTIVMDVDINHNATCSKDRTQLFSASIPFKITEQTGEKIIEWCNGVRIQTTEVAERVERETRFEVTAPSVEEMVAEIKHLEELVVLWSKIDHTQENYDVFLKRKNELQKEGRYTNGQS